MKGSQIILISILAVLFSCGKISRDDPNYQINLLSQIKNNNCGSLHNKATLLYLDHLESEDGYKEMGNIFSSIHGTDCRAIADGEHIWVRLTGAEGNKICRIIIPLNTLNLFQSGSKFPEINSELIVEANKKYGGCKIDNSAGYDYKKKRIFNRVDRRLFAANFVNHLLSSGG